jgi:hypothetical protein
VFRELFQIHLRLGFTRILFIVDSMFAIFVLCDLVIYWKMGLSLHSAAIATNLPQPFPLVWPLCAFFVFLTVLLPVILAIAKVSAVPGFVGLNPSSHPEAIAIIHSAICIFFVGFAVLAERMEMLSGWEQDESVFTTIFHSTFLAIVTSPLFSKSIAALGSLGGVAVTTLGGFLLFGEKGGKTLNQYATRARLADLPTELHPERSPFRVALTGIEANRAIPIIRTLKRSFIDKYYNEMDSRSKRLSYVHDLLAECDQLIRANLFETSLSSKSEGFKQIGNSEMFVDQDGAWEAALRGAPALDLVVVGPNCTFRVASEVEAYCSTMGLPMVKLPAVPTDDYSSWAVQQLNILASLKATLNNYRSAALITNHVSYISGLKVPLQAFIRKVRSEASATSLYIIVDGTNAVGNGCRIPSDGDWDAYIFSPDRWLLAPEPISILLTKSAVSPTAAHCGSLKDNRRSYDAVLSAIAGLRASLEIVESRQLDYFWRRCSALRRAFIAGVPKSIRILGTQSADESTFILSCYPAGNSSWRRSVEELNDAVGKICDSASILTIDEGCPWMRVTFPYYLDPRDLNRLNIFLEDNTSD